MIRNAVIGIIGFLIGIGTTVGALVVVYKTGLAEDFLMTTAYVQPQWPDVEVENEIEAPVNSQIISIETVTVATTSSMSEYSSALATVVASVNNLSSANTDLVATLRTMNERSVSRQYEGFFDLVVSSKEQLARYNDALNQLNVGLIALGNSAETVSDQDAKGQISKVVQAGALFRERAIAYSDATARIITGEVPTPESISAMFTTAIAAREVSDQFDVELRTLIEASKLPIDEPVL